MKKIVVDVLLLIFMLAEYSRVHLPPEMHEIIGIGLILLVTVHMILNRNYFKAIPRGKYSAKRMVELLSTIGFFAAFILTCIFGILSSQEILPFLNIKSLTAIYLLELPRPVEEGDSQTKKILDISFGVFLLHRRPDDL